MKNYFEQKLTYTEDGRLLDENGFSVMMDWEKEIMEESAKIITENKGDILNIGFGLGIIDTAIQKQNPHTHTIIEPHPDVQRKMIEDGWLDKKGVNVIFGKWQDVIDKLGEFDGIYIDTWSEPLDDFYAKVHKHLKPGGVFSYFNNPRSDKRKILEEEERILSKKFHLNFKTIKIPRIDDPKLQTGNDGLYYWHPDWKYYHIPIFKLKTNNRFTIKD